MLMEKQRGRGREGIKVPRNVRVHVQKWESLGGGRFKLKIAETNMNLTNIVHEGEPYTTIKHLNRGRYIVRKDKVLSGVTAGPAVVDDPISAPREREPMEYAEDEGSSQEDSDLSAGEIETLKRGG